MAAIFLILLLLAGNALVPQGAPGTPAPVETQQSQTPPPYEGQPWVVLGDGQPRFSEAELAHTGMDFSPLDDLGRCGPAFALLGPETMPEEPREGIGMVRPSGWQLVKYDFVDGKYLYNRCHLIAYQLCGENANEQNLITGTRWMNLEGMLPLENRVAEFIRSTGLHVLYRATPCFTGDHLLADGVELEARSLEDGGAGLSFRVYAYNVQPGVVIDYATGESALLSSAEGGEEPESIPAREIPAEYDYVLNVRSGKFHLPDCKGVSDMSEKNKQFYQGDRETLLAEGWQPCGMCRP